mmetsp:Transcript_22838/g.63832  ORF Transcript_22838/g.63832 Transcript_22838/m.63832 type:complete len:225 (-) Transcript_22838:201-875(-)
MSPTQHCASCPPQQAWRLPVPIRWAPAACQAGHPRQPCQSTVRLELRWPSAPHQLRRSTIRLELRWPTWSAPTLHSLVPLPWLCRAHLPSPGPACSLAPSIWPAPALASSRACARALPHGASFPPPSAVSTRSPRLCASSKPPRDVFAPLPRQWRPPAPSPALLLWLHQRAWVLLPWRGRSLPHAAAATRRPLSRAAPRQPHSVSAPLPSVFVKRFAAEGFFCC